MHFDRREFLVAAATTVGGAVPQWAAATPRSVAAIAFDAFPIFDPRSINAACEREFPGRGAALAAAWRNRQFEYQWLRSLGTRYADFWQCTADALAFACDSLGIDAKDAQREALMQEYLRLDAWPDVPQVLTELKRRGFALAFLSNATARILETNLARTGLASQFDVVISTDRARTFKPDPRAYRLGTQALRMRREEILFVAFAGWDAVGAKWFGYPTFWNNRASAPAEHLAAMPDGAGATLTDLLRFLGNK